MNTFSLLTYGGAGPTHGFLLARAPLTPEAGPDTCRAAHGRVLGQPANGSFASIAMRAASPD